MGTTYQETVDEIRRAVIEDNLVSWAAVFYLEWCLDKEISDGSK